MNFCRKKISSLNKMTEKEKKQNKVEKTVKRKAARVKELPNHWEGSSIIDSSSLKKWFRVMQEREAKYVDAATRYAKEKASLDAIYKEVDIALESVRKAVDSEAKKNADLEYQKAIIALEV
jgi:polysaccharide deacetylase 2 family uncharacterized protein YibQ